MKIVVLYNAATVNKFKCPDVVKNVGLRYKVNLPSSSSTRVYGLFYMADGL